MLATNFLNGRRGLAASLGRMSEGFADRAFTLPACASGNIIALAATGEPIDLSMVELASRAHRLKRDTGLNLLPMVSRLVQMQVPNSDRFEL